MKHIRENKNAGARLVEFQQILPHLSKGTIQVLLREMREEEVIHHHGNTRAGRWYFGKKSPDCDHGENLKDED